MSLLIKCYCNKIKKSFILQCKKTRRHKLTQVNTLMHSLPQLNGTRYTQNVETFSYLILQDPS